MVVSELVERCIQEIVLSLGDLLGVRLSRCFLVQRPFEIVKLYLFRKGLGVVALWSGVGFGNRGVQKVVSRELCETLRGEYFVS